MKRREFVTSVLATGLAAPAIASQGHRHKPLEGPLANATVSFGAWPPSDRFTVPNAPAAPNVHLLLPYEATVKAGGSVNFIVAGFHHILVYAPGTKPEQIAAGMVVPGSTPPGLIDDPNNRVYRGLDPRPLPQDRVEVVHFPEPGRYLVICGVVPHFVIDNMHGYVRVVK
jgi:hypothetical protein